jgi:hypothetical protein
MKEHRYFTTPPRFVLPTWLRVFAVVVLGLLMPSLGRIVGRLVGNESAGPAVAAGVYVAILVYVTVFDEGSRARAALKALVGGAVVGGLFWLFSR